MKPPTQLEAQISRWIEAGVIDAQTAERIRAFEAGQERRATLRWPVLLAMVFGAMLLAAGITLFVAAHWIDLSPAERFSLVLLMVAVFHAGGAALSTRFPAMSTTLHAIGTIVLGAAIFLTAQIFNLHEDWATGILLWAVGAAVGYLLLRDWVQAALVALLAPAWLSCQWGITTEWHTGGDHILAIGLVLLSLSYLSARVGDDVSTVRRVLVWIGGFAVLPCVAIAIAIAIQEGYPYRAQWESHLSVGIQLMGWTVALVGPLLLAWILRGRAAWINLLWAVWACTLVITARHTQAYAGQEIRDNVSMTLALYALSALGAVALVAWGLYEKRKERLNLGIAGFALCVLYFYFDSFMDKMGRSESLLLLGVLCLAGGFALERTRRRLVARLETDR
ncbi:MAG: DUF2157 domain-containing protein [Candidatus Acidiferrales bacterium]